MSPMLFCKPETEYTIFPACRILWHLAICLLNRKPCYKGKQRLSLVSALGFGSWDLGLGIFSNVWFYLLLSITFKS